MLSQLLQKTAIKRGVCCPTSQASGAYPLKSETVKIPSSSVPAWGSMFTIDIRELGCLVTRAYLEFQLSAITVMTSGMYVPSQFFIDHIDYYQGGDIKYTAYPLSQFLQQQLLVCDEDRLLNNIATGLYSSTSQRTNLASATNYYYLPLWDYIKQANGSFPLLENIHNIQMRIFLQPLANVTSGTGTATANIIGCNLCLDVTRLREAEIRAMKDDMIKNNGLCSKFCDLRTQANQVNSGVTNTSINLQSIVGPVSQLHFTVRPQSSLAGNNAFVFTPIASFEIDNSSGTNIVGGQLINSVQSLLVNGNQYFPSTYLAETAYGTTNNNANVYVYSFCSHPEENLREGISSGFYNFTGSEVLKINFTSALGSAVQVDIMAYIDSVICLTRSGSYKTVL